MTERPVIFNGDMVRVILPGRKTQTRRVVSEKTLHLFEVAHKVGECGCIDEMDERDQSYFAQFCPFGKPGDRLWVRECHAQVLEIDIPAGRAVGPIGTTGSPSRPDLKSRYVYRADGEMPNVQWRCIGDSQPVRWTPSIHMPRKASRILLEITHVRIERLKDITEQDAIAEGMSFTDYGLDQFGHQRPGWLWRKSSRHDECLSSAKWAFGNLWVDIYGQESWDSNPWVWVVEFKQVQS